MRKFTKTLSLLSLVFLVYGCAIHTGNITTAPQGADFTYVGQAVGQAKTFKVLGLGGLRRDALVFEAKQDLFNNRPLKEGEAYANFTVDVKNSFILIYTATTVSVTADIITYNSNEQDRYSKLYPLKRDTSEFINKVLYRRGDVVQNSAGHSFLVKGFAENGLFVAKTEKKQNHLKTLAWKDVFFNEQDLMTKINRLEEYHVKNQMDDTVLFKVLDTIVDNMNRGLLIVNIGQEISAIRLPMSGGKNSLIQPIQLKEDEIFAVKTKNHRSLQLGQRVFYLNRSFYVIAFGAEEVLLKEESLSAGEGEYVRVAYKKLK